MPSPHRWPHHVNEPHDPDAVLDYAIDWSDWLAVGESISSATWTVTGATATATAREGAVCVVFISGAAVGQSITATCRVTTDNSPQRIDDRTLVIHVGDR